MSDPKPSTEKATLDKDLEKLSVMESAAQFVIGRAAAPGLAFLFLIAIALATIVVSAQSSDTMFIVIAAVVAAYMAMNIGANDVTNNVGAAVGSKAISMAGALLIAAFCEIAGAFLAGDRVVATIKSGIVSAAMVPNADQMMIIMVSALFSAALWINLATWLNAPVSTTHSIVGSIMGAGAAIIGFHAINWSMLAEISIGWVASPIIGGLIAVLFLWFIQSRILYSPDRLQAARRWVPVLLAIMTGAFASYLLLLGRDAKSSLTVVSALLIGCVFGMAGYVVFARMIHRQSALMDPLDPPIKALFRMPLIFSAALLSFAHGANDVSNAIGPLSAIVEAAGVQTIAANRDAQFWVMSIGALGISAGLLLFGPRLIRIVGSQITKLNPIRGYCVAVSAALTVILASALGLPVSSTHIAVGSVFGVGFFREFYAVNSRRRQDYIAMKAARGDASAARKLDARTAIPTAETRPPVENTYRYLVRRSYLLSILTAWIVTVPASGLLAAAIATILNVIRFWG
jgi:PiT family inorganic phosphate transporter